MNSGNSCQVKSQEFGGWWSGPSFRGTKWLGVGVLLINHLGKHHPLEGAGMHVYIYMYIFFSSYYSIVLYCHCFSLLLLLSLHASNSSGHCVSLPISFLFAWFISNESLFNLWFVHRWTAETQTSNLEQWKNGFNRHFSPAFPALSTKLVFIKGIHDLGRNTSLNSMGHWENIIEVLHP